MKEMFEITIDGKLILATVIQWKTRSHLIPYGFQVVCPYCRKKQWFCKKDLYNGLDYSKNNYRCKYCKAGKAPWRGKSDRKIPEAPDMYSLFKPKNVGWRSV